MSDTMTRTLGKSGFDVSAMGLGCWAIGGQFWLMDGKADGWGQIDDRESIRAIRQAVELGITLFDTADVYGTGHSERILGQGLEGLREKVLIATKFAYTFDEDTKHATGLDMSPAYIRQACEASLQRLNTDYIDLYQLHHGGATEDEAQSVAETLEQLRQDGLIRYYAWSTDDPERAELWAKNPYCVAVQHDMNVLRGANGIIDVCEQNQLASLNRSPLASGFLSGKYTAETVMSKEDFRGAGHEWVAYFENGRPKAEFLQKLEAVREILTSNGRSLVQGALAWLWARSETTIPIPGFKTVAQVEENCAAMDFGPLSPGQMQEIADLLEA